MASSSRPLEKACASLSLLEDEEEGLEFGHDKIQIFEEELKHTLVGKLLTDKPFKFHIMKDIMAAVWRPGKGMFVEVTQNLFLFQFRHEIDMERVLDDGPWAFEKSLLVLRKLDSEESPFAVTLSQAEF